MIAATGEAAAAEPLLSVVELSKSFRDGSTETSVLDRVSFELPRGSTTSLVGTSGSGKTTLLTLLAGLRRPDRGRVLFEGRETTGSDDSARARLRARRIGVVLQSGNLIPFLTAAENVELPMILAGAKQRRARASDLLATLGLGDRLDELPRRLSGGEAQRVGIAVALANEPDLLLADEVTGELDAGTAELVSDTLFDACGEQGLTILLVTHDKRLAGRAEHRLQLSGGRVSAA